MVFITCYKSVCAHQFETSNFSLQKTIQEINLLTSTILYNAASIRSGFMVRQLQTDRGCKVHAMLPCSTSETLADGVDCEVGHGYFVLISSFEHFFCTHDCFFLPGPPNLGLSKQNLHDPQSTARHPEHSSISPPGFYLGLLVWGGSREHHVT